jgi:hypothetical protein
MNFLQGLPEQVCGNTLVQKRDSDAAPRVQTQWPYFA